MDTKMDTNTKTAEVEQHRPQQQVLQQETKIRTKQKQK